MTLDNSKHIYVAHKAPWFDIEDTLPRYDDFPPEMPMPILTDPDTGKPESGKTRGSCLCGSVQYQVNEPFKMIHNCHYTRCRRAHSAAFTSNGITAYGGVEFFQGEPYLKSFKKPDAKFFTQVFYEKCVSSMPRKDAQRQIDIVPIGSLDNDPGQKPQNHIFIRDKAPWYSLGDALPQFQGHPK